MAGCLSLKQVTEVRVLPPQSTLKVIRFVNKTFEPLSKGEM